MTSYQYSLLLFVAIIIAYLIKNLKIRSIEQAMLFILFTSINVIDGSKDTINSVVSMGIAIGFSGIYIYRSFNEENKKKSAI